jgi:glutamate--cysteine ligase
MAQRHENSFVAFIRERSRQTRDEMLAQPLGPERNEDFERMTQTSIEAQKAIEAADTLPFEQYREKYVSPARLGLKVRRNDSHARRTAMQRA